MHRRALENGEKYFGDIVGQDYKGETPEEGGKARDEAEDAVKEEKGGEVVGGSASAIEHFQCHNGLKVVRAVDALRSQDLDQRFWGRLVHTLAHAAGSLRRMMCLPAPRCTAGKEDEHQRPHYGTRWPYQSPNIQYKEPAT